MERLADLLVTFGANVQPGQIVELASDVGKEEMTRVVARRAYEVDAKFVDVSAWSAANVSDLDDGTRASVLVADLPKRAAHI